MPRFAGQRPGLDPWRAPRAATACPAAVVRISGLVITANPVTVTRGTDIPEEGMG